MPKPSEPFEEAHFPSSKWGSELMNGRNCGVILTWQLTVAALNHDPQTTKCIRSGATHASLKMIIHSSGNDRNTSTHPSSPKRRGSAAAGALAREGTTAGALARAGAAAGAFATALAAAFGCGPLGLKTRPSSAAASARRLRLSSGFKPMAFQSFKGIIIRYGDVRRDHALHRSYPRDIIWYHLIVAAPAPIPAVAGSALENSKNIIQVRSCKQDMSMHIFMITTSSRHTSAQHWLLLKSKSTFFRRLKQHFEITSSRMHDDLPTI